MPRPLTYFTNISSFTKSKRAVEHEDHQYHLRNTNELISNQNENNLIDNNGISGAKVLIPQEHSIAEINIDNYEINRIIEEIVPLDDNSVILSDDYNVNQAEINNSEKTEDDFLQKLRAWAVFNYIRHSQLSKLLKIMKEENKIVSCIDARTLLCTPRTFKENCIESMGNGRYLHFKMDESIKQFYSMKNE